MLQCDPAKCTSQRSLKQMPELILTSAQRQALKGRAHGLRPVVLLGAAGLTDKVLREIDRALAAHALIKVKVPNDDRDERIQIAADVAEKLSAANVQSIGKMIVLFRPQPESEEKQQPDAPMNQRTDERRSRSKGRRVISR
jgi:RNA-binding protein